MCIIWRAEILRLVVSDKSNKNKVKEGTQKQFFFKKCHTHAVLFLAIISLLALFRKRYISIKISFDFLYKPFWKFSFREV